MLSHDNLIFNATLLGMDTIANRPSHVDLLPQDSRGLSYLPLSHIAGLCADVINHLLTGG